MNVSTAWLMGGGEVEHVTTICPFGLKARCIPMQDDTACLVPEVSILKDLTQRMSSSVLRGGAAWISYIPQM